MRPALGAGRVFVVAVRRRKMILNGHIACKRNAVFRYFFRKLTVAASGTNSKAYAKSLTRHVWTFDDALTDQFDKIYLEYFRPEGLVFQFFVCPRLVDEWEAGNFDYVRRQLSNPDANLLGWEQIGRLAEAGNLLGSHGVDHTPFTGLTAEQAAEQLEQSREMIKARTGRTPTSFAFPLGYVKPSSIEASIHARKWYDEVHLSDNSIPIGQVADGVFNRRHGEFGMCASRGLVAGALNIALGIRKWRS